MVRKIPLLTVVALLLIIYLLTPISLVGILSFSSSNYLEFPPPGFSLRWYESFLDSRDFQRGFSTSIIIASISSICSTLIGTMAAISFIRHSFIGKRYLNVLFLAPLVVPYVVLATGLFRVFLLMGIEGSIAAVTIAHTVVNIPYVVLLVSAVLFGMDKSIEESAISLGANQLKTFRLVTLPLIAPGVMAGFLFAFIMSFDEFIIAFFLSSPTMRTLPVVMFSRLREMIDPTISAVSMILVIISVVLVVSYEVVNRMRGEGIKIQ